MVDMVLELKNIPFLFLFLFSCEIKRVEIFFSFFFFLFKKKNSFLSFFLIIFFFFLFNNFFRAQKILELQTWTKIKIKNKSFLSLFFSSPLSSFLSVPPLLSRFLLSSFSSSLVSFFFLFFFRFGLLSPNSPFFFSSSNWIR